MALCDASRRRPDAETPPPILAILPFRSVDESDLEIVETGRRLAASISMELSATPLFRLIDQASSFSASLADSNPNQVADVLGADLVVAGSIRRTTPDGLRVAVWLLEAGRTAPIWTERFDAASAEVEALLEALMTRLCAAIGTGIERELVARSRHSLNKGAMDSFLEGLDLHHRHTADAYLEARERFRLALDQDSGFSRAAAALAITYVREWFWKSARPDLLDTAERHARTAVDLAPQDAWAQTVWGVVALYKGRHAESDQSLNRAIELAPYDAYVVSRCGLGRLYAGDFQAAIGLLRRSIVLDPLHADRQSGMLAHALFHIGLYDEAIDRLEAIDAPLTWELAWLAACLAMKGERGRAAAVAAAFHNSLTSADHDYRLDARPFRRESDRQRLGEALAVAGLGLVTSKKGRRTDPFG